MTKGLIGNAINGVQEGILILVGVIILASFASYSAIAYYGISALETLEWFGGLSLVITLFGILVYCLFYYLEDSGEL